ncbi:hypothetical protein QEG_1436, partial [Clostridioides difficile CD127]
MVPRNITFVLISNIYIAYKDESFFILSDINKFNPYKIN